MEIRLARRLAYDKNYQKAIEILCTIIEEQDKRIQLLENKGNQNNDANNS